MEKYSLFLGIVFLGFGLYSILHPWEGYVAHPGSGKYPLLFGRNLPELVSKDGARVYGIVAVTMGAGFVWLAFCRPPRGR